MSQASGHQRPGGRTARTEAAVRAATREVLTESGDGTVEVAEVAARSGVHPATVYRRWRSADGLIIDTLVQDLTLHSPIPATGDIRADLLTWTTGLLTDLQAPEHLVLVRAMVRAGDPAASGTVDVARLAGPRMTAIRSLLDAGGVVTLEADDVVDLVLAPAYLRALFGRPLDPELDAARLVDNCMAVADHRTPRHDDA